MGDIYQEAWSVCMVAQAALRTQLNEAVRLFQDECHPTKLRKIAEWLDTYDKMAEMFISNQYEERPDLIEIVKGKGVQEDLRRWADDIDAFLATATIDKKGHDE